MTWREGDLANWGECLVEIVSESVDGLFTVEVIECEDGSQFGRVEGLSEYELESLSAEDEDYYGD